MGFVNVDADLLGTQKFIFRKYIHHSIRSESKKDQTINFSMLCIFCLLSLYDYR